MAGRSPAPGKSPRQFYGANSGGKSLDLMQQLHQAGDMLLSPRALRMHPQDPSSSHSLIVIDDSSEDGNTSSMARSNHMHMSSPSKDTQQPSLVDMDQIPFDDIEIQNLIGDGSFGEVYAATLWSHPVAVKIMRIKNAFKTNKEVRKFQKEVAIMRTLRHPNVVEFMGVSFKPSDHEDARPKLCIVTELMPSGNLEQLLEKRKLSWKRYFRFAKDIASGLNWLHHKGIIHRDLKPSNLLITMNYHIKLADFGLSHMRNNPSGRSTIYSVCGTRCYIAPEVLQKKPYDTKADVWSFGIVLCEMMNGRYPFATMDSRETMSLNEAIVAGTRPRIPDECPKPLERLLELCWSDDPAYRPSMEQVLQLLEGVQAQVLSTQQLFLEDEMEDLPSDIKRAIEEERLRLIEAQAELSALRQQSEKLAAENKGLMEKNRKAREEQKKLQRDIKRTATQRDRWKLKLSGVDVPPTKRGSKHSRESRSSEDSVPVHKKPRS